MNIFRIPRIASHPSIGLTIAALLLLALPAGSLAQEKKEKKKDSTAQSKPAPSSKTPPASTSGKSSSSTGSAGSHTSGNTGGRHTDNSGGTSTSGNTGRTRSGGGAGTSSTTGNSGGTSVSGNSAHKRDNNTGAATGTSSGSGTTDNVGRKHRTDNTGSANAAGSSGATGTSGDSGASQRTGKPGKTRTTDSAGTRTDGTGGTSSTTTTNVKGNKRDRANATGGTGGTTTSGRSSNVTTANVKPGFTKGSNGKPEMYRGRDGSEARFRHDGTIREVHTRNMTIIHRPGGSRTVIVDRPDRSRIVVNRFGHGYVQRPFVYRGHEFANRTYFYRGRPYALYYRGYAYRGVTLHGYVPYRYYSPAFYGWAYRPWYRPVRYSWGWAGSPWYGYYGRSYFTPYSVYPSASFWLTDYLISTSLQAAYEERLANQSYNSYNSLSSNGEVILSPEVKDQISNEVQRQLALENSESRIGTSGDLDMNSSGLPRMLAETSPSNPRIFVVAGSLDVTDNQGQDCTLTEGDVLRLSTPPAPDATSAYLQVLATKNPSCAKGSMVSVGFSDLQEMQNHMRATIDRGLQDLQAHQGGLPVPPANAAAPPVQASFAPIAPPPDANASSELQQQAQEADAADKQVLNEVNQADDSGAASGASTQPDEISLGQTIGEVESLLGKPKQIVNLGARKMYVYPSMKITFVNGKVSDVQ